MGNAPGNLHAYWREIRDRPARRSNVASEKIPHTVRLQGGFIWDWADQGILVRTTDGQPYWAYGGDFGEAHHDGFFCNNGLVSPDRTPHPSHCETKWCHQRVATELAEVANGAANLIIHNRHDHVSLAHLSARWRVLDDGMEVVAGAIELPDVAWRRYLPTRGGDPSLKVRCRAG